MLSLIGGFSAVVVVLLLLRRMLLRATARSHEVTFASITRPKSSAFFSQRET